MQTALENALKELRASHTEELDRLRRSQEESLEQAIAAAHVNATAGDEAEWSEKEQRLKADLETLLAQVESEKGEKEGLREQIEREVQVSGFLWFLSRGVCIELERIRFQSS